MFNFNDQSFETRKETYVLWRLNSVGAIQTLNCYLFRKVRTVQKNISQQILPHKYTE